MPFISKITTYSFDKETFWAAGGFMILAGLILIGGGGFITSNSTQDLLNLSGSIGISAICIGIFVTIVSFLGCFGAANEKGILLKTYFGLLMVLVILEIGVGAAAYSKQEEVDGLLAVAWRSSVVKNTTDSLRTIKFIQLKFNCCGFENVTDAAYPSNCSTVSNVTVSCREQIGHALESSLGTVGGAGLAIGIIELIGLLFSVILFRKIAQRDNQNSSLLNEAWRINRNKIQYGYQTYQYV